MRAELRKREEIDVATRNAWIAAGPRRLRSLTDRALRARHKPQRYGTQYDIDQATPAAMKPQPTEDPAHVDQRRASMDLMPRADYECVLRVTYAPGQ